LYKCVNKWCFPDDMSLEDIVRATAEIGFEGLEPAYEETHLKLEMDYWRRIKELGDSLNIKFFTLASGLHWKYNLASSDHSLVEKGLEVVRDMCKIASTIGASVILVVPGVADPEVDYEKILERARTSIKRASKIGEEFGIKIGVENVWNRILTSPIEFRDFIDSINSEYIGAYFDVGNTYPQTYPQHWIRVLGKRIVAVHVKDFLIEDFRTMGFTQLLQGSVDWSSVMKSFREIGYNGPVTVEVAPYRSHPLKSAIDAKKALDIIFEL